MAAQAGLCLAWLETPEDTFCREVAQVVLACNKVSRMANKFPENVTQILWIFRRDSLQQIEMQKWYSIRLLICVFCCFKRRVGQSAVLDLDFRKWYNSTAVAALKGRVLGCKFSFGWKTAWFWNYFSNKVGSINTPCTPAVNGPVLNSLVHVSGYTM